MQNSDPDLQSKLHRGRLLSTFWCGCALLAGNTWREMRLDIGVDLMVGSVFSYGFLQ